MATFKNQYIDNVWKSAGMPAVALPGTSPVQYSRTPSVFIPALLAAIIPGVVITALATAWNNLQTRLTGAPPTPADVSAITAAIVVADGAVQPAQTQVAIGSASFGETPFPTFVADAGRLGQLTETLANQLDASNIAPYLAPLVLTDLGEWGANANAIASQLNSTTTRVTDLNTIVSASIPPSATLPECVTNATEAGNRCLTAIGRCNATAALAIGAPVRPDVDLAGVDQIAVLSLLQNILAWANTNSGGPAVSIAAGAPFATVQAWATAQGI